MATLSLPLQKIPAGVETNVKKQERRHRLINGHDKAVTINDPDMGAHRLPKIQRHTDTQTLTYLSSSLLFTSLIDSLNHSVIQSLSNSVTQSFSQSVALSLYFTSVYFSLLYFTLLYFTLLYFTLL